MVIPANFYCGSLKRLKSAEIEQKQQALGLHCSDSPLNGRGAACTNCFFYVGESLQYANCDNNLQIVSNCQLAFCWLAFY